MDRERVREKMCGWESEEREARHGETKAEIETDWGPEKVQRAENAARLMCVVSPLTLI